MNFSDTTHNVLRDWMKFIFIFCVIIYLEECAVSSFRIEEPSSVDISSALRKISSFVASQKAVIAIFRITLKFFTPPFKETAVVIFPSG
jgi:hypothetical protein